MWFAFVALDALSYSAHAPFVHNEVLMFGSFGWMELMLILIIVLIIFGAGKLPQLGEGLGKAIKGFKKSVHEADAIDVTPAEQSQQAQTQAPSSAQVSAQSEEKPSPASQAPQTGQVKQG